MNFGTAVLNLAALHSAVFRYLEKPQGRGVGHPPTAVREIFVDIAGLHVTTLIPFFGRTPLENKRTIDAHIIQCIQYNAIVLPRPYSRAHNRVNTLSCLVNHPFSFLTNCFRENFQIPRLTLLF